MDNWWILLFFLVTIIAVIVTYFLRPTTTPRPPQGPTTDGEVFDLTGATGVYDDDGAMVEHHEEGPLEEIVEDLLGLEDFQED